MPIEQVRCENCGSGDVRQLAADSYVCEHCQTNFRLVDPTKSTVVQKPSVCDCGLVATAFCVRCHKPLCEGHRESWWAQCAIDSAFHPAKPPDEARHKLMNEHRIPEKGILCAECKTECNAAIKTMAKPFTAAARQGQACWLCNSDQIVGRCANCNTGAICSKCSIRC